MLVDRPGRGYGDDYSPWLVDAPVGELVRVRGAAVTEEGILAAAADDCLFCQLVREGDHVAKATGFVAINDINPQAPRCTCWSSPSGTSTRFREIGAFSAGRGEADARVRRGDRARRRADRLPGASTSARARGQTVFHLHWHVLGGGHATRAMTAVKRAVSLVERIEEEVKEAMLAREDERRDALRLILDQPARTPRRSCSGRCPRTRSCRCCSASASGASRRRRRSAAGGREEQAAKEEAELEILEEFMPEPLSEDELERIVDDAIAENGATSIRDMGRVMADVMPQIAGRADGSAVGQLVREKLA